MHTTRSLVATMMFIMKIVNVALCYCSIDLLLAIDCNYLVSLKSHFGTFAINNHSQHVHRATQSLNQLYRSMCGCTDRAKASVLARLLFFLGPPKHGDSQNKNGIGCSPDPFLPT